MHIRRPLFVRGGAEAAIAPNQTATARQHGGRLLTGSGLDLRQRNSQQFTPLVLVISRGFWARPSQPARDTSNRTELRSRLPSSAPRNERRPRQQSARI